jgi:protein-disulfide isomerase
VSPPLATYSPGADPYPSDHPAAGPTPPPVSQALTLGRPGAAVTIVEFGDYQCTSCGAFARDTEPALIRRYVDAGVVRLVWRDFPWVDGQSVDAAVAARAAGMQGRFWAFHDYLFAHQLSDEHSGLVTGGYLRSVARRLGLNMAAFDRDVAGPALAAAVRADGRFGQQLGVPGTPAFLINGQQFFGAQPLAAFEAAIANARGGQ